MADEIEASSELSKIARLNGDFVSAVHQRRAWPLLVLGGTGVRGLFSGPSVIMEARSWVADRWLTLRSCSSRPDH